MSLNESIVEDAALILPAATLTRPLSHGEKEKREAIRRPAAEPGHPRGGVCLCEARRQAGNYSGLSVRSI